jgi:peptidoglycan/LPS O-acetylase OafA/YrhL
VQRVHGLDALRAVAISAVIIFHLGGSWIRMGLIQDTNFVFRVTQTGSFGVQLFFIISGYLLSLLYSDSSFSMKQFFYRRVGRILPLWFIYIFIWLFIHNVFKTSPIYETSITWVLLLFLLTSLTPQASNSFLQGNSSISNEWIFYMSFPLLRRLRTYHLIILGSLFYIFGAILRFHYGLYKSPQAAAGNNFLQWIGVFAFWNAIPFFVAGMLIQRFSIKSLNSKKPTVIFSLLLLLVIVFLLRIETYIEIWIFVLPILFIILFKIERIPKPLYWVGQRSYGLFFSHFLFIGLFERLFNLLSGVPILVIIVGEVIFVVIGAILASSFTWRFIENPAISWSHQRGREAQS